MHACTCICAHSYVCELAQIVVVVERTSCSYKHAPIHYCAGRKQPDPAGFMDSGCSYGIMHFAQSSPVIQKVTGVLCSNVCIM